MIDEFMNVPPAVWQEYEVRVNDEFVLRGNAGLLKCLVPSYVSDVVQIESWTSSDGDQVFGAGADDWGKLARKTELIDCPLGPRFFLFSLFFFFFTGDCSGEPDVPRPRAR